MTDNIFHSVFKESDEKLSNSVFPAVYFREIVRRERSRSDRSGQPFAILIFEIAGGEDQAFVRESLIPFLLGRVRCTDSIGWAEEAKLAVLLPDTTREGGAVFLGQIVEQAALHNTTIAYRAIGYPSEYPAFGNASDKTKEQSAPAFNSSFHSLLYQEPLATKSKSHDFQFLLSRPMPVWKRALDLGGSILGMVVLSPLFLLIACLIKCVSKGPVFFTQPRVGYLGKTFTFWKFRTMHVNADSGNHRKYMKHLINSDTPMTKLDRGNRSLLIPFGRILRKTSVDELPQLINVFLGQMSLVGPRPCLEYEAEKYLQWHARRFDGVPGLTGLWQISGKNHMTFKEMIRLDIRYANEMSLWLDVKIMLKTLPAVVKLAFESKPKGEAAIHVGTN